MKQIVVNNLQGLEAAASQVLSEMGQNKILAISGKMGAGKTTFIKALCNVLGVTDVVISPSFSLVNVYVIEYNGSIYHFDLYRLKKINEVYDIGYEEYFFSDHFCFVEWPELILELLPDSYVYLRIEVGDDDQRVLKLGDPGDF